MHVPRRNFGGKPFIAITIPAKKVKEISRQDAGRNERGSRRRRSLQASAMKHSGWAGRWAARCMCSREDVFIQISVGGSGDAASKLEKSKTLAQFILKRL